MGLRHQRRWAVCSFLDVRDACRCADEVRKDRKKAVKNDSVHRLASIVHTDGREGVEAAWEKTPEFHEAWKAKARDMLARAEFRRQKLTARLKVRVCRSQNVHTRMHLCMNLQRGARHLATLRAHKSGIGVETMKVSTSMPVSSRCWKQIATSGLKGAASEDEQIICVCRMKSA